MTAVENLHSEYKRIFGAVRVDIQNVFEIGDAFENAKKLEQEEKDDFAIGFAEWMHSNTVYNGTEYYSVIGHVGHHKLQELLQIYKSQL